MSKLRPLKKKLTLRQQLALLLASILLIGFVIAGLTIKDRTGLNLFTRWFTYSNEDTNASFPHGAHSGNLFANLNYKLLVCSDAYLQLFTPNGESVFKEAVNYSSPGISSNGKQAVVYEVGGQKLSIVNKKKIIFSTELPEGQYILSANVNQNGWMAVTSKKEGLKGVVSIYNPSQKLMLDISVSSSYLQGAMVTPDCKGVYVLAPGQFGGIFESRLLYYDDWKQYSNMNTEEEQKPKSQVSLGNNVVLSMQSTNSHCWVLAENDLFILSNAGEISNRYSYGGKYLKRGSLGGNDFATLLLSNSPSGNTGTLVTVDADGKSLGSLDLNEQVLALSAAGRYVAVLTPSSLRLYTKDLSEVHRSESVQDVQNIVVYPDGSMSLISDELARLYIP